MGVVVRKKKGDKSGAWWVIATHRGVRKTKKCGSKKAANEFARAVELQLAKGSFGTLDRAESIPSLRSYATKWLQDEVKALRRPATYERYESILRRHVFPKLGNRAVDNISRGDLRRFFLALNKKGMPRSTLGLVRDVLSGPMGAAVDDELIAANPVTGVLKRLNLENSKQVEFEPPDQAGVERILTTARAHFPDYHPFFVTAFKTGMRLGELIALEWEDVDWDNRTIKIVRSFRRKNTAAGPTKTGKTRRVDMSDQLVRELRNHQKKGTSKKLMFPYKGGYLPQNQARRLFKRILTKADMPPMRVHDIRHTFASTLLSAGLPVTYVSRQLGHSSIKITFDVYGHWIKTDDNKNLINAVDSPNFTRQSIPSDLHPMCTLPKNKTVTR